MGDDPMALLGLEGALKHYLFIIKQAAVVKEPTVAYIKPLN
jgi:hypothetical protein